MANFKDIVGKTIVKIKGLEAGTYDKVVFTFDDGTEGIMQHYYNCCESVYLEDVCGDVDALIGSPILVAEESSSDENPPGVTPPKHQDCYEWTFYKIDTAKGGVTLRWYGESSWYYSMSVDFALQPIGGYPRLGR